MSRVYATWGTTDDIMRLFRIEYGDYISCILFAFLLVELLLLLLKF